MITRTHLVGEDKDLDAVTQRVHDDEQAEVPVFVTDEQTNRQANQPTNQPANQPINQPTNEQANQSTNHNSREEKIRTTTTKPNTESVDTTRTNHTSWQAQ